MTTLVVVGCGVAKATHAVPARDLYVSPHARAWLATALGEAGDIERVCGGRATAMIMSAKHGLLALGTVVEPYDVTIGSPGAVPVHVLAGQLAAVPAPVIVEALLTLPYRQRLAQAAALVPGVVLLDDLFVAPFGGRLRIGYQRAVADYLRGMHGVLPVGGTPAQRLDALRPGLRAGLQQIRAGELVTLARHRAPTDTLF